MNRATATSLQGVIGIFGAGLVHTLLPVGVFSTHDVLFRALVTACAAVLVTFVAAVVFKPRISK
jgi:hypothetical protein